MVDQLACDREGYLVCLAGELMLIERGPLWGDQSKKPRFQRNGVFGRTHAQEASTLVAQLEQRQRVTSRGDVLH